MKILSIDGGGIFGVIPAYFLSLVDVSQFDIFCGTSVGSILASFYATNRSPENSFATFLELAESVFSKKSFILSRGPKFKDKNLNLGLQECFKDLRFKDLEKKLVIPSFSIQKNRAKVFENLVQQDENEKIWEVCRRSCSAPSYFKSFLNSIDGGIVANNPSLVGVTAVVNKLKVPIEEIEVFSIGTGLKPNNFTGENVNKWFRWQWIRPMLSMVTAGNEISTDFFIEQLPLKNFCRFNEIPLNVEWNFTDPSLIEKCLTLAESNSEHFLQKYEQFSRIGN
jgi:patatin-like phospholipase/acyl hydrolase